MFNQTLLIWGVIALILSPISYLAWLGTRKDKLDDSKGFQGGTYYALIAGAILLILSFFIKPDIPEPEQSLLDIYKQDSAGPEWMQEAESCTKIGNQVFCKLKGE